MNLNRSPQGTKNCAKEGVGVMKLNIGKGVIHRVSGLIKAVTASIEKGK